MKPTAHFAEPALTSAARTDSVRVTEPHQPAPRPAPSLRVPVTPRNRQRLRSLRAAESRAWDAVPPAATLPAAVRTTLAGQRVESRLQLGVSALERAMLAALREAEFEEWMKSGGDFLGSMHQPVS